MNRSPAPPEGQRIPKPQPAKAAPLPSVQVLNLRPTPGDGALKALVDLELAGKLQIHELRVVQQDGGAAWVSMPTRSWDDPETGRRMYRPLVVVPPDWKEAIEAAVLSAWRRMVAGAQGR